MSIATYHVNYDAIIEVPLTQINSDIDINPRLDGLDRSHVESLKYDFPDKPLKLATLDNGVSYVIVGGYHRFYAATELGMISIKAYMVIFTRNEYDMKHPDAIPTALQLAAYEDNITHGKMLTIADRKEYAIELYMNDPSLSWLQLSKLTKLSDKTVKAYITSQLADSTRESADQIHQVDYTKRLLTALDKFYTNETAFLAGKGSNRSEHKRATALVQAIKQPTPDIADRYDSLARTLNQAAAIIRDKARAS